MLKTTMTVQLRCFDVLVEDQRTRETKEDAIVSVSYTHLTLPTNSRV